MPQVFDEFIFLMFACVLCLPHIIYIYYIYIYLVPRNLLLSNFKTFCRDKNKELRKTESIYRKHYFYELKYKINNIGKTNNSNTTHFT